MNWCLCGAHFRTLWQCMEVVVVGHGRGGSIRVPMRRTVACLLSKLPPCQAVQLVGSGGGGGGGAQGLGKLHANLAAAHLQLERPHAAIAACLRAIRGASPISITPSYALAQ